MTTRTATWSEWRWLQLASLAIVLLAPFAYAAVASFGSLLLVMGSLGPVHQRSALTFWPDAEVAALGWLAAHSEPEETVLSSVEVANVIPARTDRRVFAGQGPETLHEGGKQADLQRFLLLGTGDAGRQTPLADFGLDSVFYGPREQALGGWKPAAAGCLMEAYSHEGYSIYRVAMEGSQP